MNWTFVYIKYTKLFTFFENLGNLNTYNCVHSLKWYMLNIWNCIHASKFVYIECTQFENLCIMILQNWKNVYIE